VATNIPTSSMAKASENYPNWDFGLEISHLAPLVKIDILISNFNHIDFIGVAVHFKIGY
jgi:hypothetical protein